MMKTLLPLIFLLAFHTAQACETPSNLDVKEAFPFGFTLIWDAVKGAQGYILYYRRSDEVEAPWIQVNTKTNAVTLTGMAANTEYLIRLCTVCKNDTSKKLQAKYTTPRVSKHKSPMLYTLQMSEGRISDAGGQSKDYGNNEAYAYKILTQAAGKIQLDFSEFSLGANDTLFVYDGSVEGRLIGRYIGSTVPKPIVSSEASITLLFVSDSMTNSTGWKGTWKTVPTATPSTLPALAAAAPTKPTTPTGGTSRPTQVPTKPTTPAPNQPTVTPPTSSNGKAELPAPATALAPEADYTGNFTLTFSDTDRSGKGVANRFANIAYTVGGKQRSNPEAGMIWEDFRNVAGVWNGRAGVWKTEKGKFLQTDTESKNTNLSTALTQNDKTGYLYHWRFAMQGKNSSLRAGMHFFCSNPALENRGNSYLIFIRDFEKEADVVELYECVDNILNLKFKTAVTLNEEGTTQDLKIMYLPARGKIEVYVNDVFANSWVDDSPLRSGNALSLRSSGCVLESQSLVVYRERSTSMDITIGDDETDDISLDQQVAVPVQISTLIVDRNQRWSAVAQGKTRAAGGTGTQAATTASEQPANGKPCPDKLVTGKQIRGNYTLEFAPEKGVFERYVLVSDYDSEAGCWHANQTKGFLVDEFCGSSLEDEWSSVRGSWKEENGELLQMDQTNANTNVAIPLLQQNDGKYLYQVKFNILDPGENRRLGLHFFSDDPEKTNRGNSYLVVVRSNDKTPDQLEMYRCENDQINLVTSRPIDIKPNQWADMKLIFSPATGVVNVYLNDAVVLYWKDDKIPFSTGKGISLRTGGTRAAFDDVRVYKQYTTKMPVRVGDNMDALLRYETKQTKPAARVYQITRNPEAKILSSIITESTVFFQ